MLERDVSHVRHAGTANATDISTSFKAQTVFYSDAYASAEPYLSGGVKLNTIEIDRNMYIEDKEWRGVYERAGIDISNTTHKGRAISKDTILGVIRADSVDLSGAYIDGISLPGGSRIRDGLFIGTYIKNSDLIECELVRSDFHGSLIERSNLSGISARGISLDTCVINGSGFLRSDMRDSDFVGLSKDKPLIITGSTLNGSDISGSTLENVVIKWCSLRNVNAVGVRFKSNVTFESIDCTGIDLRYATGIENCSGINTVSFNGAKVSLDLKHMIMEMEAKGAMGSILRE